MNNWFICTNKKTSRLQFYWYKKIRKCYIRQGCDSQETIVFEVRLEIEKMRFWTHRESPQG